MTQAEEILKKYWGYDSFRYPQNAVIEAVMQGNDVLALMPTGGGKSITFQVPAMLKEGICIVISPLIALMTDQVAALKNKGIRALSLAGSISHQDLERLLNNALYGDYKFLYMSPERLGQPVVQNFVKSMKISLIAIDEAHCVSHWGKDFRPAYLQCGWLKEQFPDIPLLALTASATPKIQQDIVNQLLMKKVTLIETSLSRPNIAYHTLKTNEKWQLLERILRKNEGFSIVYMRSRGGTLSMAEYLTERGFSATFFHGGLSSDEKDKKLTDWLSGRYQVMVATNAFGMGIDKAEVRTVIHWDIPTTLEDYFQEAGRAGRDGKRSVAVLLYSENDLQNAKNQVVSQLIDIPFLKLLYAKLNAHFKIAYGEGYGISYSFDFASFCKKYELDSQKVYNGLLILDRFSILSLSLNFTKKTTLQFLFSNTRLMEYLKSFPWLKDLVFYLLRTYTGIYQQPKSIDIQLLSKKSAIEITTIYQSLQKLQKDGVIAFESQTADTQIVFNVMRDDDRTIDSIAKNLKEYNQNKLFLQKSMFDYIENDSQCKSVQLLKYFGEKNPTECGICSVCVSKEKKTSINENTIENQLVTLLNEKPRTITELMLLLPFEEKQIQKLVFNLLEMSVIQINHYNEIILKKS